LDSGATELMMSIEFAKKHEFKLKIFESTNIAYCRYFLERTYKKAGN